MRCLTVLLAASTASALQPLALKKPWRALGKAVAPALLGVGLASSIAAPPANAADKRQIASITASGLVFKDKLIVDAFADPKVEGVTLYVSDFERPVVERVQKDFFSDPSRGAAQTIHPHAIDATPFLSPQAERPRVLAPRRAPESRQRRHQPRGRGCRQRGEEPAVQDAPCKTHRRQGGERPRVRVLQHAHQQGRRLQQGALRVVAVHRLHGLADHAPPERRPRPADRARDRGSWVQNGA